MIYLSFLGMPTFIISIGIIQGLNFVSTKNELTELNKILDKKVLQRTSELLKEKEKTEQAYFELEQISKIDPLTNLFNRMQLLHLLNLEMKKMSKTKIPFCLLIVDLDFFKQINDNFGHLVGDEALRITGRLITELIQPPDFSGRFGDEEFCIAILNRNVEESVQIAENFRTYFHSYPFNHNDAKIQLSCSIGLTFSKTEDTKIEEIIERADKALYLAKINGRNQIKSY